MKTKGKIASIIILLSFIYVCVLFNGSIDEFVPKHIAVINDVYYKSSLTDESKELFPAFIALGSIILILTDISAYDLMFYPFQWLPYALIFFCLIYKLSNSLILSSTFTLVQMSSGTTGTLKNFFWPHGLGELIFFLMLILCINLINKRPRTGCSLIMIILAISLSYYSYNLWIILVLFISALIIWSFYFDYFEICYPITSYLNESKKFRSLFISLLLVLIIVQLGLSNFIYDTALPKLTGSLYMDLTSLDKFMITFISVDRIDSPLAEWFLTKSDILLPLGITKQGLLVLSILVLLLFQYRVIKHKKKIDVFGIVLVSIITAYAIYVIMRINIGSPFMTLMTLPGIFSAAYLYRLSNPFRIFVYLVTVVLVVSTPLYYYEMYKNNSINKDINKLSTLSYSSEWLLENADNLDVALDELTKNLFSLHFSVNNHMDYGSFIKRYKIMTINDILFLLQLDRPNDKIKQKYFIINNNLNFVSLQNWIYLNSWNSRMRIVNNNRDAVKIYDSDYIGIYYNP